MEMDGLRRRTRRGLATATAHLTATEGPLRLALEELARRGVGARIVKGALAATLAWAVAGLTTPASPPFVASLTALFTVQLTIKQSVEGGRNRLLGVLVGVAVAFGVSELVGLHSWSVGVVVLVALVVGVRLRLASGGVEQVAATAIVVMFVQSTTDERALYAVSNLADTAIGTGIGLLLNALVAPPDHVPAARAAVQSLGRRLVFVLEDVAAALADGTTATGAADLLAAARVVQGELDDVDEALGRAEEGLAYNLMGGRQRGALARCRELSEGLRGTVYRTLSLTGSLSHAASGAGGAAALGLGHLAAPAAEAVSAVSVALLDRIDGLDAVGDDVGDVSSDADVVASMAALEEETTAQLGRLAAPDAILIVPVVGGVLALGSSAGTPADASDISRSSGSTEEGA